jgi:hypothetical protein
MRTQFPELQFCEGDWKAEAMAVEYYHGWVDRPTSTTVKNESNEVKIKNEKSCELSLTLAASSSKRPTSLTIQSEHVKKQKTSDASLEPVPASRPALQVSRNNIFHNTSLTEIFFSFLACSTILLLAHETLPVTHHQSLLHPPANLRLPRRPLILSHYHWQAPRHSHFLRQH